MLTKRNKRNIFYCMHNSPFSSFFQLAFRSTQHTLRQTRNKVRKTLYLNNSERNPVAQEMEETIDVYLRKSADKFDISNNIQVLTIRPNALIFIDRKAGRLCTW